MFFGGILLLVKFPSKVIRPIRRGVGGRVAANTTDSGDPLSDPPAWLQQHHPTPPAPDPHPKAFYSATGPLITLPSSGFLLHLMTSWGKWKEPTKANGYRYNHRMCFWWYKAKACFNLATIKGYVAVFNCFVISLPPDLTNRGRLHARSAATTVWGTTSKEVWLELKTSLNEEKT